MFVNIVSEFLLGYANAFGSAAGAISAPFVINFVYKKAKTTLSKWNKKGGSQNN
ncbi:hypothetical protein ACEOWJ_004920 [Bacillus cereus]